MNTCTEFERNVQLISLKLIPIISKQASITCLADVTSLAIVMLNNINEAVEQCPRLNRDTVITLAVQIFDIELNRPIAEGDDAEGMEWMALAKHSAVEALKICSELSNRMQAAMDRDITQRKVQRTLYVSHYIGKALRGVRGATTRIWNIRSRARAHA